MNGGAELLPDISLVTRVQSPILTGQQILLLHMVTIVLTGPLDLEDLPEGPYGVF